MLNWTKPQKGKVQIDLPTLGTANHRPFFLAMKKYAESFYKSKQWQKCRELCIQRAGGLCERCRAEGIIRPAVIAHHKKEITPKNINNPEITLNLDNLEALCMDCHAKVHHPNRRRYKIDERGRVVGLNR